ncbi:DNA mismatch repair protein MutS [Cytophagaceae bacterium ABcell3]|nr:DNA mismatch repair protein MutS [Cytophagaceae bacterium ABcell3]
MKQYNAIKKKYPGALLLFRVGDFYETFGEDAINASRILNITLTKRGNGTASEIALAGFPHHSLDSYLPKLVRAGQRVAICDQLEDPKSVKGIVKRGVTELVTPGVSYNDNVLEVKQNNYLAAVHFSKDSLGVSFLDISTGEFLTSQGDKDYVEKLIQSFNPSEILYCKTKKQAYLDTFDDKYNTYALDDWVFSYDFAFETLTSHFGTTGLKGFGIENLPEGIVSAGVIFHYLNETEHKEIKHIQSISRIAEEKYVWLDKFTIRNLELVFPQHQGGVPLLDVVDATLTPMGGRMLRKWLLLPLKEEAPIKERHDVVQALVDDKGLLTDLVQNLKQIGDLERLISKVAVRRVNPRELNQLRKALEFTVPIKQKLQESGLAPLKKLADQINNCEFLVEKITKELKTEVPLLTNQGNLINEGVDSELDELRKIAYSGKDFLLQIQQREVERTGITSLKIAYNKVFGYYLEVTNAHKDKVPEEWIRKQTLVNAERYITEELKTYEEKILNAEDKINIIEQRLFQELVMCAEEYVVPVQQNARVLATLDCLMSFAQSAINNNYIRPVINNGKALDISAGRHPVIEKQLPPGEPYIPNDIYLDDESQQIIIITGPNMAGKSALLRQTALIVLMAQTGSFVPAKSVEIGLVDKIFTRVGASDNLSRGESTFMVEMNETASILNNLSERSLVLMDEIGRGTSTYDGISIAWSIVEYLHNHKKAKAKTLFATHYHELNQLADDFPRIKNFNVSVKEAGNKIIFMRKLKEGGSEHSFGIHVAQLAGMPNPVVFRASEILHHLEKDKVKDKEKQKIKELPKNNFQLSIFGAADPNYEKICKLLEGIDINTISPVEALLKLNQIKILSAEKEKENL